MKPTPREHILSLGCWCGPRMDHYPIPRRVRTRLTPEELDDALARLRGGRPWIGDYDDDRHDPAERPS